MLMYNVFALFVLSWQQQKLLHKCILLYTLIEVKNNMQKRTMLMLADSQWRISVTLSWSLIIVNVMQHER